MLNSTQLWGGRPPPLVSLALVPWASRCCFCWLFLRCAGKRSTRTPFGCWRRSRGRTSTSRSSKCATSTGRRCPRRLREVGIGKYWCIAQVLLYCSIANKAMVLKYCSQGSRLCVAELPFSQGFLVCWSICDADIAILYLFIVLHMNLMKLWPVYLAKDCVFANVLPLLLVLQSACRCTCDIFSWHSHIRKTFSFPNRDEKVLYTITCVYMLVAFIFYIFNLCISENRVHKLIQEKLK